jgi:hypothetical protein
VALPRDLVERASAIQVNRPWWVRMRIWWHKTIGHAVIAQYYTQLQRYILRCESCNLSLDFVEKAHG